MRFEDGLAADDLQRGMLAQLAARLRARSGGMGTGDGEEEGGPIVVDENCSVSNKPVCRTIRKLTCFQVM